MRLVFVGHRCCDHSPSSGYDQVCALFPEAGWLNGPELVAGRIAWFREPASIDDTGVQLFHVIYGDCSGRALPALLRKRFPKGLVVATVHQPIERLREDPSGLASLYHVDGIITVSEVQAKQLALLRLNATIRAVPHGVWTRVFRPRTPVHAEFRRRVLLVGNYLRDWAGTAEILRQLCEAGVGATVVGTAAVGRLAVRHPLVELRQGVPEAELAELYHQSAALLLPVLDATASNALLEAMAGGCPVICPRLPSLVEEYLGDDMDAYEPGRYNQGADLALAYVGDPERRAARSRVLLERASRFDWSRLRPMLRSAYDETVERAQRHHPGGDHGAS